MTDIERASPPSRKRILVVDDSSLVRLYYRDTLEKAGFEVEQAINGIEAMEKVLVQPFDLVIVDVNMPRMDGFSFLRALRSSARRRRDASGAGDHHRGRRTGRCRGQGRRRQFLSGQAGVAKPICCAMSPCSPERRA